MTAPVFVDTNVLIYALDDTDLKKQAAAREWRAELWKRHQGRISFQVLQEFYVNITRKWPKVRKDAQAEVRDLMAWRPVSVDGVILEQAWKMQECYQLSFWDALIVAAAKSASCRYLLTEDLQSGQDFEGLLVLNPFRNDPISILSA
jgi:predicted nucleic acid-binding protein